MAGVGHFYVTMHGEFKRGGWIGEAAQMGLRWTAQTDVNPQPGPIFNLPDLGGVEQVFVEEDLTSFSVNRTYNLDFPGVGPQADWYTVSDDIATDCLTFLGVAKGHQVNTFEWNTIKVAPIERGTGRYLAPATIYTIKAPVAGTSTNGYPPEVSIAMSLRTAVVGKRGRGRMYLPALDSTSAEATGKVAGLTMSGLADGLATLVRDLENLPSLDQADPTVVICSAASTTGVMPHEVRVGNHFDVQRRRQHQVEEVYNTVQI